MEQGTTISLDLDAEAVELITNRDKVPGKVIRQGLPIASEIAKNRYTYRQQIGAECWDMLPMGSAGLFGAEMFALGYMAAQEEIKRNQPA